MKKGEQLSTAIVMATNAHAGQLDRGGRPYILHTLAVMGMLGDNTDEETQMIAVLHDAIEDTSLTYKDLRDAGFSERVISGVAAMTKLPGQTYEEYKSQVKSNRDAVKVKMCDLRHNSDLRRLKGVSDRDIDRAAKYLRFYAELQALEVK